MAPEITQLSAHQLRRAAELKEKIESLQSELNGLLGSPSAAAENGSTRRHHMSAAAIARISAAQKARWAKIKKATGGGPAPRKGKRKMSAAGRARLAEVARARWKAAKASGKSAL